MLECVGVTSYVLRQGFPVVFGEDPRRAPIDKLVQVARGSPDSERDRPQIRAALQQAQEGGSAQKALQWAPR